MLRSMLPDRISRNHSGHRGVTIFIYCRDIIRVTLLVALRSRDRVLFTSADQM